MNHDDDPARLVKVIRDWFVATDNQRAIGPTEIWYQFNDFSAALEETLLALGFTPEEYEDVPIPEVMSYMDDWFQIE